jgi:hypothetical protein
MGDKTKLYLECQSLEMENQGLKLAKADAALAEIGYTTSATSAALAAATATPSPPTALDVPVAAAAATRTATPPLISQPPSDVESTEAIESTKSQRQPMCMVSLREIRKTIQRKLSTQPFF